MRLVCHDHVRRVPTPATCLHPASFFLYLSRGHCYLTTRSSPWLKPPTTPKLLNPKNMFKHLLTANPAKRCYLRNCRCSPGRLLWLTWSPGRLLWLTSPLVSTTGRTADRALCLRQMENQAVLPGKLSALRLPVLVSLGANFKPAFRVTHTHTHTHTLTQLRFSHR